MSEQFCDDRTGRNSQGCLRSGKIGRTVCDKAHRSKNNEQVKPINIESNGNVNQVSVDSDYLGTKVSYHTAPLASHP